MESKSYYLGENLGKKMYLNIRSVDYNLYFPENNDWIKPNSEEHGEIIRLENIYDKSKKFSDWNKLLDYFLFLDKKYLPNIISDSIEFDFDLNKNEFIEGLIDYLSDTDFCSYSLKKDEIYFKINKNIVTIVLSLPQTPNYI